MVGRWALAGREFGTGGDIRGRLALEWMEGGFYLVQHIDIDYGGRRVIVVEYVGYDDANNNLRS